MEGEFDVRGRIFVITGGDKGLGLETVRRLVQGGGQVIIGCRDAKFFGQEADTALSDLCGDLKCGLGQIKMIYLDLAKLTSVKKFCDTIISRNVLVDVLICNAGVMSHCGENVTEDGLELHYSVNYLGHFLIIQKLRPLLQKSLDPRVIAVSSILLRDGKIDVENLGSPSSPRNATTSSRASSTPLAYSDSKMMMALIVQELQRREPHLSVFSVSPGWCRTNLGRSAQIPWYSYPLLVTLMLIFGNSVKSGADSIVFCASEKNLHHLRGKFVRKRKVYKKIERCLESQGSYVSELWNKSETKIQQIFDRQETGADLDRAEEI